MSESKSEEPFKREQLRLLPTKPVHVCRKRLYGDQFCSVCGKEFSGAAWRTFGFIMAIFFAVVVIGAIIVIMFILMIGTMASIGATGTAILGSLMNGLMSFV